MITSYTAAILTVGKATLDVTPSGSKTYGSDDNIYSFSASGWKKRSGQHALDGHLLFNEREPYVWRGSDYVSYASGGTLGGAAQGNYAINYLPGQFVVQRAPLSVSANSDSKTYDGRRYSGGNGVSIVGFVLGQDASVLSGALEYAGNSQGALNVGQYEIMPQGYVSANYAITYNSGPLQITQRDITVAAQNIQIVQTHNSVLTWMIISGSLVSSDRLTGQLYTDASMGSPPGEYPIQRGTLGCWTIIKMTYVPGTLVISSSDAHTPQTTMKLRRAS